MKIDLSTIDRSNFLVHEHIVAGELCYLIQPNHIGAKWTKDTLIFRSSLWNLDGELISASFKKFFNWSEQPDLDYTPFSLTANGGVELMEKIDGSTLILSKYKGQLIQRTRGTTDATKMDNGHEIEWLKEKYPKVFDFSHLPDTHNYSYIYEWVSPENKIVLNYGEDPDIYLIAVISHEDYTLLSQEKLDDIADGMGVKRPKRFKFSSLKEMLETVEAMKGQEGICVYCNKGQSIRKCKSAWYLSLHKMKSELGSYERVVDLYFNLPSKMGYTEFYQYVVDTFDFELAEQIKGQISKICECMKEVNTVVNSMKEKVLPLKSMTRKDAAVTILQKWGETNRAAMCFKILDNKELGTEDLKKLLYQVGKN